MPLQLYGCKMDTVNLAADKFTEGMGSRMTEFVIDPAKGTAEMRTVSGWVGFSWVFGWWGFCGWGFVCNRAVCDW